MKNIWMIFMMLLVAPMAAQSIEYQWHDAKGNLVQLDSYKGKPVLLHFWASWCPPCRKEMPAMSKWVIAHPDVKVVMISMDSSQEYAAEFYADKGIQTPLNMGDMSMTARLGVRALPTSIIIDADGEIKSRHLGDIDWDNKKVSQQVLSWL